MINSKQFNKILINKTLVLIEIAIDEFFSTLIPFRQ